VGDGILKKRKRKGGRRKRKGEGKKGGKEKRKDYDYSKFELNKFCTSVIARRW